MAQPLPAAGQGHHSSQWFPQRPALGLGVLGVVEIPGSLSWWGMGNLSPWPEFLSYSPTPTGKASFSKTGAGALSM